MKRKLNEKMIAGLKREPAARYDVHDTVVTGFKVRVGRSGKKTYALFRRFPGKGPHPIHGTIGTVGSISLADARAKARRWIELADGGKNPMAEAAREAREAAAKEKNTFANVAEEWLRRVVIGHQRKGLEVKRDIEREFIPRWGARHITEIKRADVTSVIKEVATARPYQARNLFGHVRALFNWAIECDEYGLEVSPCDRVRVKKLIGRKGIKPRDRTLSDGEVRALWAATEDDYPYGQIYRMLLLTGQRRGEVAWAPWSEFDLKEKLWTIPAERMKMDTAHLVPLSDDVLALLGGLPRLGDYLFTFNGHRPVNGFGTAKEALEARLGGGVTWTVQDIRRTVRTHLSAIPGTSDLVRELVIAHTKPGLHKVYDQHAYLDEKRHCLEAWALRLRAIVNPTPDNVVAFRAEA